MYHSRLAFALAMAALAAILMPSSLTAQITFQRTYEVPHGCLGYSTQQTADGGYVIAGTVWLTATGPTDMYLIKTDAYGDTLWTRTYGGDSNDYAYSVQQTTDSGFVIAGMTYSFGAGGADVYLVKTNANGDTQWTRTYGGTRNDGGYCVRQTLDGGFVIAGDIGPETAASNVYLIRTNAMGIERWARTLGSGYEAYGYSVQQTSDGGYIVAGSMDSLGMDDFDVYLVRTDSNGGTLWVRRYGGDELDEGFSVQQTADSAFIVAGSTYSFGAGEFDAYLVKTKPNGDTLWTKTLGGEGCDYAYSLQLTRDSGYVIAGQMWIPDSTENDACLIKTDAHGNALWTRTYGGTADDEGRCVQPTSDGGYVIAGSSASFVTDTTLFYLVKTDSLGTLGVAESKAIPPRAPALALTCEPNPFRTRTAISLQLTADSPAELAIFDMGGRRVRALTVNRAPCTVWDGKDELGQPLPSGAYFARLAAAGQHATTCIVLQR